MKVTRTGHIRDSWEENKRHREILERKYSRIEGLRALLTTHQQMAEPDAAYIIVLRRKLHAAKNQFRSMGGATIEDL